MPRDVAKVERGAKAAAAFWRTGVWKGLYLKRGELEIQIFSVFEIECIIIEALAVTPISINTKKHCI
jgi:hypothetical protein